MDSDARHSAMATVIMMLPERSGRWISESCMFCIQEPVRMPSITKDGSVATAFRRMGKVKKLSSSTEGNAASSVLYKAEMKIESSVSPPLVI